MYVNLLIGEFINTLLCTQGDAMEALCAAFSDLVLWPANSSYFDLSERSGPTAQL